LVLLRFRCFFGPGGLFYYGFVAFLFPDIGFNKVSLLFGSNDHRNALRNCLNNALGTASIHSLRICPQNFYIFFP
jgi:hypothetical protein